jgi:hypothetical protein
MGAITVLAPPQLSSEALQTHNFAPICDFFWVQNNPPTTPPMRNYSIRAEKLARYVGVDSPVVVYPFGRMRDSELFSHVFQSTNQPYLTTFLSWRIYLIAHTPKNCRLEFICPDFQSPKLIQFRTPPQNAPILPLLCVKFGRFQKPRFSISFAVSKTPHTV